MSSAEIFTYHTGKGEGIQLQGGNSVQTVFASFQK